MKTVASKDSAALVGIAIAIAGIALHQLTGLGRPGLKSRLAGPMLLWSCDCRAVASDSNER
ncbi:MAG: hypothetical protein M3070_04090 [Actinomycetota bacterium]|nr:hypothetical protein [Actinomycetota bacterium]